MKEITIIKNRIEFLKQKQTQELFQLKKQFGETANSLKPLNILKQVTQDIIFNNNVKSNLINGVFSLSLNYFSKKLFKENSNNVIKQFLGNFLNKIS